jgi:hypothetical protein
MTQWGKADSQGDAPEFLVDGANSSLANSLYNNVGTLSVIGANVAETQSAGGKYASPGWQAIRRGTGPVTSITITDGRYGLW